MKKILILVLALCYNAGLFAQENELKNFRFGLKATPSLNWFKPDDKKKFETGGTRIKFGWGLATEFRLSSVAVIATGLQVDYDGGGLNLKDTALYAYSNDEIIMLKDTAGKKYDVYKLNERKYNVNYVTIPLTLKMKTKEIGYMTYFGQFGLMASLRTKARVNDKVKSLTTQQSTEQTDIDVTDDMSMFRFGLVIGGGAEYNLSGSTSLVFGLAYNYGFSNVLKSESKYLVRTDSSPVKQKAFSNNVGLSVGILF